ncbi:hypothetical protein RJ640_013973 [Escallonia rubra]|uniref:Reverse transcriptase RNase H-like domain-containing protein n=1 Tax=Escallonia rubra TaxID=112253 RepID=A0AA88QV37_9ASTE|nr:hypothetical protein RJ640_013973 [Escallonia rubra]
MANSKERINALEAQMADMFKSDHHAPGILKKFSLRLDALEENLEGTDNARNVENSEDMKVSMAAMYLVGGAKLWWRKKYTEIEDGSCGNKHMGDTKMQVEESIFPREHRIQLEESIVRMQADQIGQPPTDEQPDTQDYEEEDVVRAFLQWCNAARTHVRNTIEDLIGEKPKDMPLKRKGDVPWKGLMYADIKVNGKAIRAMVDAGATHNYISSTEVDGVWRHYLLRSSFVVRTDNIAVSHFLSQSKLTSKQARWQEHLAEFNFMLEYKAGSTNSVADALSRRTKRNQLALAAMSAIVRAESRVVINIGKKLKKALTKDSIAQQLLKLVESDGQTERFNSMLEEYLCHFVNAIQKNWVKLLDVAQLYFNSSKRSSTGKSAFEIVNDQQPLLPHTVNVPNTGKSPKAISSEEWRLNIDLAHSYLEKIAKRMKKHADNNRRSQEFNVGDKVMVKLLPQDRKFLRGRDSRLLQKYEGPLTIVKKIGKMAYKVAPPQWWSRQLHPVFHVSMLKPFYEDATDPLRG